MTQPAKATPHCNWVHLMRFSAHWSRFCLCVSVNFGFITARYDLKNLLQIVVAELYLSLTLSHPLLTSLSLKCTTILSASTCAFVIFGRPERRLSFRLFCCLLFEIILYTVTLLTLNAFAALVGLIQDCIWPSKIAFLNGEARHRQLLRNYTYSKITTSKYINQISKLHWNYH